MKKTLATVVLLLCTSAATAQDWTGPYLGLSLGRGSGDFVGSTVPIAGTLESGEVYGLFAGYNLQRNNVVYGAELAFQSADLPNLGFAGQGLDRLFDFKTRVGYAAGPGLAYGVLGYSTNRIYVPGATSDGSGFSYGIGYDYQLTETFTLGGEILSRQMENDETPAILGIEPDVTTFAVRAGIKF
jgi:outer membrane immunogenic protein